MQDSILYHTCTTLKSCSICDFSTKRQDSALCYGRNSIKLHDITLSDVMSHNEKNANALEYE